MSVQKRQSPQREPSADRERRERSAFWLNIILIAMFTMGLTFMWEADTKVISVLSYACAFVYNGVASLAGWDLTSVAVIAARLGTSVWFIFSGLFIFGWLLNKQSR